MKTYQSHKIVKAAQIIGFHDGQLVIAGEPGEGWAADRPDGTNYDPKIGDYLVEYEDGYRSLSPKAAFEAGYHEWNLAEVSTNSAAYENYVIDDSRLKAYQSIDSERAYQQVKWGGKEHEVGAFIAIMEEHLARARTAWCGTDTDMPSLHHIRKVTALGVACMEKHGAPRREGF